MDIHRNALLIVAALAVASSSIHAVLGTRRHLTSSPDSVDWVRTCTMCKGRGTLTLATYVASVGGRIGKFA